MQLEENSADGKLSWMQKRILSVYQLKFPAAFDE